MLRFAILLAAVLALHFLECDGSLSKISTMNVTYEGTPITFGNTDEGRVPFTGRFEERERIKTKIKEGVRIIQINGPPFVGKARLLNQCVREFQVEQSPASDSKIIRTTFKPREKFWLPNLQHATFEQATECFSTPRDIYVFEKCENFSDDPEKCKSFVNHCLHVLHCSRHTVICLSSQSNIDLGCEFIEHHENLEALLLEDAVQLLKRVAPSVTSLEMYAVGIVKKCKCLPEVILQVGKYLKKYKFIKPVDLLTAWESPKDVEGGLELYSQTLATQKNLAEVSRVFRKLIKDVPKLCELRVFSGSFSSKSVSKVLGFKNDMTASLRYLKFLQDNSFVTYNEVTDRFRIHSFVEFMADVLHVKNPSLQTKVTYVNMMGDLLNWLNNEVFASHGNYAIRDYLYEDDENIRNVFQQCVIPNAELYPLFFKIATTTDELIVPRYQMAAVEFYENLLDVACCLGKTEDMHILQAFIGKVKTRLGCGPYKASLDLMKEAEPHIRKSQNPFYLKFLLSSIAWNYQKQGENIKALRYFEESAQIRLDSKNCKSMDLLSKSRELIARIFLGDYKSAKDSTEALLTTLCQESPNHPVIPVLTNGLGIIYERSEHKLDKALQYYKTSLAARNKHTHLDPCLPIVSECNIGKFLSVKKGLHKEGLKHIERALDICEKTRTRSYLLGLAKWYYGQILMALNQHEKALPHLERAREVIKKTDFHVASAEVQYHLAKCYIRQGNIHKALEMLYCSLELRDKYIENVPTGQLQVECLEIITDLEDDETTRKTRCGELIYELTRLRNLFKEKKNHERSEEFNQKIFNYSQQCEKAEKSVDAYLFEIESFPDKSEVITNMLNRILHEPRMTYENLLITKKRLEKTLYELKERFQDDYRRYTLCCSQISLLSEALLESLTDVCDSSTSFGLYSQSSHTSPKYSQNVPNTTRTVLYNRQYNKL